MPEGKRRRNLPTITDVRNTGPEARHPQKRFGTNRIFRRGRRLMIEL